MTPNPILRRGLPHALLAAGILLLCSGAALAQGPSLRAGVAARYLRHTYVTVSMNQGERASRFYNDDSALISFTVDSVGRNYLRWTRSERGEQRMGGMSEGGERREALRKGIDGSWEAFATDTAGTPLDDAALRYLGGISRVNGGVDTKVLPSIWFLPARLRRGIKGAILSQTYADRIAAEKPNEDPVDISYMIELRHAGTVDTLGRRATRIEWAIDSLRYESGAFTERGVKMTFNSRGGSRGVAYYDPSGMLMVLIGEGEIAMVPSVEGEERPRNGSLSRVKFVVERK